MLGLRHFPNLPRSAQAGPLVLKNVRCLLDASRRFLDSCVCCGLRLCHSFVNDPAQGALSVKES